MKPITFTNDEARLVVHTVSQIRDSFSVIAEGLHRSDVETALVAEQYVSLIDDVLRKVEGAAHGQKTPTMARFEDTIIEEDE